MTQQELVATLVALRESKGLTKADISHALSINWQRVQQFENGTRTTTMSFIFSYLKLIGATLRADSHTLKTQDDIIKLALKPFSKKKEFTDKYGMSRSVLRYLQLGKTDMSLATFLKLFPNPEII